jgi:TetR/AcrR family transcriptional regulator, regulator of cefoperazone and chloramphenicol sensitivity
MEYARLFPCNPPAPVEPSSVERIRDAALTNFADHGIAATSLRMVADTAGVSIGLVQHYFRTKAALVSAVENYVLEVVGDALDSTPLPEPPSDSLTEAGRRLTSIMAEQPNVIHYLGRALAEGGVFGLVIFNGLIAISAAQRDQFMQQGTAPPDLDPQWAALLPLILRVGTIMLSPYIERYLGEPFFTEPQLRRWDDAVTRLIRDGQLVGAPSVIAAGRPQSALRGIGDHRADSDVTDS